MIRKDLLSKVGLTALKVGAFSVVLGVLRSLDSTSSISDSFSSLGTIAVNVGSAALIYGADKFMNRRRNPDKNVGMRYE